MVKRIWGWLNARLLNLYSLRAAIVAVVVSFASQLPPGVIASLASVADELGLGYRAKLVLAVFGGFYVMADMIRARSKAVPEAAPAYAWLNK
jgi:hypothetical protein